MSSLVLWSSVSLTLILLSFGRFFFVFCFHLNLVDFRPLKFSIKSVYLFGLVVLSLNLNMCIVHYFTFLFLFSTLLGSAKENWGHDYAIGDRQAEISLWISYSLGIIKTCGTFWVHGTLHVTSISLEELCEELSTLF